MNSTKEREVILRDHDKKVKIWNPVIAGIVTLVVLHKVRTNKLRVAEKLKRGDKVIVIRVPGLVYKARKNR